MNIVFRFVSVFFMVFASAVIGGCSRPAAVVDGKDISMQMVDILVNERLHDQKGQNAENDRQSLREAVLQELINEQLALNEAASKGIVVSDAEARSEIDAMINRMGEEQYKKSLKDKGITTDAYLKRVKEKITLNRLVQSFVDPASIDEQLLREYYQNSQTPFLKPARVNMKIIEFKTESDAYAAVAELKRSRLDFDNFARKLADEKMAEVTDYGWVSPEFFSAPVASAIKMLRAGQQGGPYQGKKGYYLVRVKERQDEEIAKFEDVRDSIRNTILQQKRNEAFVNWLQQKRNSSKIVINMK